jgi:serine/threonine protein kinase
MEYLHGKNLEELLNEHKVLPIEQAVSIVADTCLALDYIHKRNIIHRDIKPSNIIILDDGVVKLTDFGVTRDMNSMTMTKDGSLVGTISYASPEQDSRELDGRSDIFSLGIVLYEILTGEKPFAGDTIASVLLKIATKEPAKPSQVNPQIHKMLENIILKALAKSLSQRYSSAIDMHNELKAYKEALASNNTQLLSGLKMSEKSVGNSGRVDSIPPGKIQAKDILSQSIPPGKILTKEMLMAQHNEQIDTQESVKPKITLPPLPNPNLKTEPPIINKVTTSSLNLSQSITQGKLNISPEPKEENHEIEEKRETVEPLKTEKTKNTSKHKSHVSEQLENERKHAIKRITVPLIGVVVIVFCFFTGIISRIETITFLSTVLLAYYEFNTAKISKFYSYILNFLYMFIIFFDLKTLTPTFQNSKISPLVYYILDLSLVLIAFIGAFFILKGLDSLTVNKNKYARSTLPH